MKFILVATMATMLTVTSSVQARLLASTSAPQSKTCTTLGDCPTQFCGSDNLCHDFSCPVWFQKGGWNEASIGSTQLACEDYSTGDQDENYAVVYGCQAIFGPAFPAAKGSAQPFNRKCTASIGKQVFECYDLKPSTDFGAFLSHAESAPESCIDQDDGSVLEASFIYQTRAQSKAAQFSISSGGASSTGSSGFHSIDYAVTPPADTFDASRARFTMMAFSTKSDTSTTFDNIDEELNSTDDDLNNMHGVQVIKNDDGSTWTTFESSGAPVIKPAYATAVLVGLMALLF
jgi:hypothetical protein